MVLWLRYAFQAVAMTAVVLPLRGRERFAPRTRASSAARRAAAR